MPREEPRDARDARKRKTATTTTAAEATKTNSETVQIVWTQDVNPDVPNTSQLIRESVEHLASLGWVAEPAPHGAQRPAKDVSKLFGPRSGFPDTPK